MKNIRHRLCVCVVVITLLFSISVPLFAAYDAAEISKISIDEERLEATEDIKRYETMEGKENRYLKFPEVQEGDVLHAGDIVETFEHVAARIDFSADQYVLLGTGTEDHVDCKSLSHGNSCTRARFEGFQDGCPFWYIKDGFAMVSNMLAYDARAEVVELRGTEYYFHSGKTETTIGVLDGAVKVIVKNVPDDFKLKENILKEKQQLIITTQGAKTSVKIEPISSATLNDIYRWMRHGMVVIREPGSDTVTDRDAIQLQGRISGGVSTVDVMINGRKASDLPVRNGEFAGSIPLSYGKNIITVQASTGYGEISDAISLICNASFPSGEESTDNTVDVEPPAPAGNPDLYIAELLFPGKQKIIEKNPVNVRVKVSNQGTARAGRFTVEWQSGEKTSSPACSWTVDGLARNQSTTLNCEYSRGYQKSYKTITSTARVDVKNTVKEQNEKNNEKSKNVAVVAVKVKPPAPAASPDLYVSDLSFSNKQIIIEKSRVNVQVKVSNRGSTGATGKFTVEWRSGEQSKQPACSWLVNGLARNQTKTFTCTYRYQKSYSTIATAAVVDTKNTVNEQNENNNSKLVNITVATGGPVAWGDPVDVEVPDVVGMTKGDAEKRLREKGFKVEISEKISTTLRKLHRYPVGTVIRQNPRDTSLAQGSTVKIVVKETALCKSKDDAIALIETSNLKVGQILEDSNCVCSGECTSGETVVMEKLQKMVGKDAVDLYIYQELY